MLTLDELIADLQRRRARMPDDGPVRLVIRRGAMADMHSCLQVALTEGLEGQIVLILAGDLAATSDWPPVEPDDV